MMEREPSLSLKPLSNSGKILRGLACATVEAALAVTEGLVLYHYNNNKKVSTEYLSLSNFIVAAITIYISIIVGNLSDRAKGKFRRKQFVFFFTPIYAIGTFFRYGAFIDSNSDNSTNAAAYYLITYTLQIVGRSGLSISNDAWNMELANEEVDRSKLYSTIAAMGVLGITLGLGFTALPLILNAFILPILLLIVNFLNIFLVPEGTPLSKRCFIPTVANISSVLWNTQYCYYLLAMSCLWFLNSIPAILLFFLRYAVHQDDDEAKSAYTYCLITFIFIGMCSLFVIPTIIEKQGKLFASNLALWGLFIAGIAMFIVSYVNVILVILVFGTVGFFSTMSNTVYNILAADCVDYDELLTGMKRASSYTGVTNLPYMFITIAGSSLPLALMSSLGFEEPADDDEANDDGYSTQGSTMVIRAYCSCFVSLLAVGALVTMRFYKIDNTIHQLILENIFKRESMTDFSEREQSIENPVSPLHYQENENEGIKSKLLDTLASKDDELPPAPAPKGMKLETADDPITGKSVAPPPYVVTLYATEEVLQSWDTRGLEDRDKQNIRFLGYYFPHTITLLGTNEGLWTILLCSLARHLIYLVVFSLSIWQTIVALIDRNEFGTYLIVVLTVIYSCCLAWELLHWKGYMKLIREMKGGSFPAVQEAMVKIGLKIEKGVDPERISIYVSTKETILVDTIYVTGSVVITFIGAYLALNLT